MIQEEFRPILEELEAGRSAVLHRTVDGVEYTRLFRPRERLILLGGGAAVIAIALVVIWLAVWLFCLAWSVLHRRRSATQSCPDKIAR